MTDDREDAAESDDEAAVPSSSASIPHDALRSATLRVRLERVAPSAVIAGIAAITGALLIGTDAPAAISAAAIFVAGAGGARAVIERRRQLLLRSDRMVLTGLVNNIELRFAKITSIRLGRRAQTTSLVMSPASFSYAGDAGTIDFDDFNAGRAGPASQAVFDVVAPRLVQQFERALRAGQAVHFGHALVATGHGLTATSHGATVSIAWRDVDRIDATPAGVRIFAVDRPDLVIEVPRDTDNAVLIGPLANRMRVGDEARPRQRVTVVGWPDEHVAGGALVCGLPRTQPWANVGVAAVSAGLTMLAVAAPNTTLQWAGGFFGGLFTAVAAGFAFRDHVRTFAVYERGVANRWRFLAFDDVVRVQRLAIDRQGKGGFVGRDVILTFTDALGRTVRFRGEGAAGEAIADAALRRVLPLLVSRARRAMAAGHKVWSGQLAVTPDALVDEGRGRVLAFDDVDSTVVVGSMLQLRRHGDELPAITLYLGDPDALVVKEIIEQELDERRARRAGDDARQLFQVDSNVDAVVDVDALVTPRR